MHQRQWRVGYPLMQVSLIYPPDRPPCVVGYLDGAGPEAVGDMYSGSLNGS